MERGCLEEFLALYSYRMQIYYNNFEALISPDVLGQKELEDSISFDPFVYLIKVPDLGLTIHFVIAISHAKGSDRLNESSVRDFVGNLDGHQKSRHEQIN